jgi:RNA polymerase sigma-70 factor (ECF subfamily)
VLSTAPLDGAPQVPAPTPAPVPLPAPLATGGAAARAAVASVGVVTAAQPAPIFPDADSTAWVAALGATGPAHDAAVERLHALLLRAARFELRRRGTRTDLDDLAHQAAHDALVAILAKLHTYRGQSRFTTWAYKFALLEAGVKARRRAWQGREVVLDDDGWALVATADSDAPAVSAETAELLGAAAEAIRTVLTPHQRAVLVAITLQDVPIDVLAERLGSTRGALYKTLHDARRKLRAQLALQGLLPTAEGGER